MIEVSIDQIRMSLMSQNRVVILKDKEQDRYLPIWIGAPEADAITLELQEVVHKRPLTHDLLKAIITQMGGEVLRIVITELRRPEDIFYAKIVISIDDREIDVDSRPSDAIALAVRVRVPIYVDESVMEAAAVSPEQDMENQEILLGSDEKPAGEDRLQLFKDFVDTLDLDNLDTDDNS